jgi:replication factor C subunit 1
MFTSIYRPKTIEKFIGNKQVMQPFIQWLLEWEPNNTKNKCALVSGLCGIGKTLLVELILMKHDYNIINLALDDERNKSYIDTHIKPLIKSKKTYDGQENVLVVSDIDSGSDYGFINSLVECIKLSQIPVICICDNRYDQSIKPILNYCFDIKLTKPNYPDVYRLVYNVVVGEKIRIKESEIKDLYEQSNGDIRFILNTLQFGMRTGKKNIQSSNIFETTGKMLSMDETIDSKLETYWLANDIHILMIQENYINNTLSVRDEAKKMENISYSADALSDSVLFEDCVNMANWEFEPYVAMSAINASSKCNKKAMIKFPQFLGKVSTMYKNKREKINYENTELYNEKERKTERISQLRSGEIYTEPIKEKIKKKTPNNNKNEPIKEKDPSKPRGRPKKT